MAKHGVSYAQRQQMYDEQAGLCRICETPGSIELAEKGAAMTGRLCVDHCHKTGKVRGLICNSCNIGLGVFKDNVEVLQRAIEYLKE